MCVDTNGDITMSHEKLIHDWMVSYLKERLSRDYDDIRVNLYDERKNEYKGHYPDLILSNHGMVLAIMEVETEKSINEQKAGEWKELTSLGVKLILMVPRSAKSRVVDFLWKEGMVEKVSVGTYEISINMP